jgi:hypothetical protein
VPAGDTVSLVMPNGLMTLRLLLGAMHGGCCVNPVNLLSQPEQMRYVLEHSDCKLVFAAPEWASACASSWPAARPCRSWWWPTRDASAGLRRARPARTRCRRARCGGAADVHLGHHRRAQGRDADAGQPGGQRTRHRRRTRADPDDRVLACCRCTTSTPSR